MLDNEVNRASLLRQVQGSERIDQALRGVEFPITKKQLVEALQDEVLDIGGARATLADIVRGIPSARFADAASARQAVDARWARFAKSLAAIEQAERFEPK